MATKKSVAKPVSSPAKKAVATPAKQKSAPAANTVKGAIAAKTKTKTLPVQTTTTNALPGPNAHNISLKTAQTYIKYFKQYKPALLNPVVAVADCLPNCETFNAVAVKKLLSQPGCEGFRIHLGLDKQKLIRMILVGVDKTGKDITVSAAGTKRKGANTQPLADPGGGIILEDGQRCPQACPPPSALTGG